MKINFILPSASITGGIRVVFEYANRLSTRGHEVTILYPTIPSRMDHQWFSPWARITQIAGTFQRFVTDTDVKWFDLNTEIRQLPSLSSGLNNFAERFVPDADITIATAWQTAYFVDSLSKSKGKKAYFVQHYEIWDTWDREESWASVSSLTDDTEKYPIEMYEIIPSDTKARRQKQLVDQSYRLPLHKITISTWLAELLETKFEQDVAGVVPNSVNHSIFYPEETADSETVRLLLSHRDSPWKGHREILYLINKIQQLYNVDIHTFGSGDGSDLPNSISHHGRVSDKKLRQLYSNSDIFIYLSWVEGFGLPPLEAMACKCAVVATNVGAVPDYAEDDVSASIIPPRDGDAAVEAVSELIDNSKKRQELQKRGYDIINEYTWNDATQKLETILNNI